MSGSVKMLMLSMPLTFHKSPVCHQRVTEAGMLSPSFSCTVLTNSHSFIIIISSFLTGPVNVLDDFKIHGNHAFIFFWIYHHFLIYSLPMPSPFLPQVFTFMVIKQARLKIAFDCSRTYTDFSLSLTPVLFLGPPDVA